MLKEAIEKIVNLAGPKTFEVEGKTYSSERLVEITPSNPEPSAIPLYSLYGLTEVLKKELKKVNRPVFVQIVDWSKIEVFSVLHGDQFSRQYLYHVHPRDLPSLTIGSFLGFDEAMIAFRSKFEQNEGTEYLLDLLSRVTDENKVTSTDNGVTQSVEARTGIALAGRLTITPYVKLRPYRTFLEVQQPESEFLVRVREGGQIGLFESDGGMWKLDARKAIKAYLDESLSAHIAQGDVVVMT